MIVSGLPRWYIAALIGGNHYSCWIVEYNQQDAAALLEAEKAFWDCVSRGVLPPIDGSESTTSSIKARYGAGGGEAIDLPNKAAPLLARWDELKELKAGLDEEQRAIQNQLCEMLGNAETGILGEGDTARKVTWKSYPGRATIDGKALKADLPDVYEKYLKHSAPYRRFSA
jgi:predicted phage-related endonuclease